MAINENVESCGSRTVLLSQAQPRHHWQKPEINNEVLRRIQESNFEEANLPGFDDQLWLYFNQLPARYALDVNVERAEDVLAHKRVKVPEVLQSLRFTPRTIPSFISPPTATWTTTTQQRP
ncbi:hypothetical protein TB2_019505 [Malus domestica]